MTSKRFSPVLWFLLSFSALPLTVAPAGCERSTSVLTKADATRRAELDRAYRVLVDGYNAETGARQLEPETLERWLEEGRKVVVLDIREPNETAVSTLPGARALPPDEVAGAAVRVPDDAAVVTYCTAGYRSGFAAVELEKRLGRPVYNLDGGIIAWFNAGGPVVDPEGKPAQRIHPYGEEWAPFVHSRVEEPNAPTR